MVPTDKEPRARRSPWPLVLFCLGALLLALGAAAALLEPRLGPPGWHFAPACAALAVSAWLSVRSRSGGRHG